MPITKQSYLETINTNNTHAHENHVLQQIQATIRKPKQFKPGQAFALIIILLTTPKHIQSHNTGEIAKQWWQQYVVNRSGGGGKISDGSSAQESNNYQQ